MPTDISQDVANRLAHLPPARREAVLRLLRRQTQQAPVLQRRPPGVRVPLSFAQQRIWLLQRLRPDSTAYNEVNSILIPYAVDMEALRRAVNEIIRRHEALRTSFPVEDEEPVQRIAPVLSVDLPLLDLRRLPSEEREAEALRLVADEARVAFDIAAGPLVRCSMYRLGETDYLFALTLHHLVCDGWSMGVFVVELFTLYWSFVAKQASPLPELPLQYGDFAVWQQALVGNESTSEQLAYWRQQLAGLPTLELPADRSRPAEFNFRGRRRPLELDGELARELVRLAESSGVTLFVLLLTAFYVLLHRYTGQADLVVGSPVAGRNRKELEPLIGLFINTLVLRADLAGDPPFAELLGRVRETVVAGIAHQDAPFERIIQDLNPVRDKSRNPLFQIAFQLFQRPSAVGIQRDILLPFVPVETGLAKFDLTVELIWTETRIHGHVEYSRDLFDTDRIDRLLGHYRTLLEGVVSNPRLKPSELPLLTPAEREHLLVTWNDTGADYPRDRSVCEMFAAVVAEARDATAVVFGEQALNFADLDRHSDQIAGALLALGIGKSEPVGLHLERCLALPSALLGILKAGAAFVPLDVAYPAERLAYMIADSGVKTVVTTEALAPALASFGVVALTIEQMLAAAPAAPRVATPAAEDLAYVMYTSGSTGQPKGVAVTHRNILRTVMGTRYVTLQRGAAILQFSPISFDASTFEIWGSLLNGGKLVIHPPGLPTIEELGAFIYEKGIDTAFLTTALFRQVVEVCPRQLRRLRQLITGGEVMPVSAIKAAWVALPRTRIMNAYGPTECTTFATIYTVDAAEKFDASIPIGRPIENTSAYILDPYGNPVPVGVPGELWLGGDGVSRGYWRRPELTDERFVVDRFGRAPGGRLYRTGDIASYRADGNILFWGRRDGQVKVNGFRIELAEVEGTLEAHPAIAAAVAILASGDSPHLIAFAEFAPGSSATVVELRQFLAARLPPHAVPPQIEIVERLPLTPAGKVDRDALALSGATATTGQGANAPPRDETEQSLAQLWEELLNVRQVGVADNFFDLGGHSLAATRLLSRVRRQFGAEVTMRQFFDEPTVAGLAAALASAPRSAA